MAELWQKFSAVYGYTVREKLFNCFTASILALIHVLDFSSRFFVETNISNELNFSDTY